MERLEPVSQDPNQVSPDALNAWLINKNSPIELFEKPWEPSGNILPWKERNRKIGRGKRAAAAIMTAATLFTGFGSISKAIASPSERSTSTLSVSGEVVGICGKVVDQAERIANHLVVGGQGYDKLTTSLPSYCGYTARATGAYTYEGQYWCTNLIYDSYNLVGFKVPKEGAVVNMRRWWKTAPGYKYVDYQSDQKNIYNVRPGYAMFMEKVPGVFQQKEHVALVKTILIDGSGNGQINTIEANTSSRWKSYRVRSWQVQGTSYPVRGFGGA